MSSPRAKVHILVGPRSTVRVRILSTPVDNHTFSSYTPFGIIYKSTDGGSLQSIKFTQYTRTFSFYFVISNSTKMMNINCLNNKKDELTIDEGGNFIWLELFETLNTHVQCFKQFAAVKRKEMDAELSSCQAKLSMDFVHVTQSSSARSSVNNNSVLNVHIHHLSSTAS